MFCLNLSVAQAADWPNWRGPDYNGISKETGFSTKWPADGPKVLWKFDLKTGYSTISVSDGRAYSMGNDNDTDIIYCLDALTGKEIWRYSYPELLDNRLYEGGPNATPTVAGGKVYTISRQGKAFCLDAKTGNVIWKTKLNLDSPKWGISSSPVIVDWLVIYNAGTKGVALKAKDGSIVWQSEKGKAGYASAVPYTDAGRNCVAMFTAKKVVALLAGTGRELWSYDWETKHDINSADPVIIGNYMFISSGYGRGCALLKFGSEGATKLWENKNMRNHMNSSVFWQGYFYGIDDKQLACIDCDTGEVKWTDESTGKGSLMMADGKLIVLSEKGELMIAEASPDAFKPLCSAKILPKRCWTVPVLANGKIYARDEMGNAVCVDVSAVGGDTAKKNLKAETTVAANSNSQVTDRQWPQWHGPDRNNISPDTGLLKKWPKGGPKMLWSNEDIGTGNSTVSIANGQIYITGDKEKIEYLTCLSMDGKIKWQKPYGPRWRKSHPDARTTPTVENGKVYVISGMGKVVCFDAADGKEIWAVDAGEDFEINYHAWGVAESPLIVDDKLICTPSGEKTAMVALNKNNGKVIWASKGLDEKNAYCSPIAIERGGKKIILSILAKSIIGVNAENGDILWQYACSDYQKKPRSINCATPVYKDGSVYFTSGYDMGSIKLDIAEDGMSVTEAWTDDVLDNHHGGVVLVDGYIYGSNWLNNKSGNWVCTDWKTGKAMYETTWENKGPITYADGMLYCGDEKNHNFALVKATPKGFNVTSSFNVPLGEGPLWAHPVVFDGKLYIRHGEALMVYDVKAK
jgi:outer membrane protein assembly factor BamB